MGKSKKLLGAVALGVSLLLGLVMPIGDTTPAFAARAGEDQVPPATVNSGETSAPGAELSGSSGANETGSGGQEPEEPLPPETLETPTDEAAPDQTAVEEESLEPLEAQNPAEETPSLAKLLAAPTGVGALSTGPGSECNYATPGTGAYASSLCWLNLDGVTTQYELTTANTVSDGAGNRPRYTTTLSYQSAMGSEYGTVTVVGAEARTAFPDNPNNRTAAQAASVTNAYTALRSKLFSSGTGASATYYGPVTGWPIEINVSSTYKFTALLDIKATDGDAGLQVNPVAFPTYSGAFLGNSGFYTGVAGKPALYQAGSGGTTTASLRDIQVVTRNAPVTKVTGFSVVVADAESTDNGESIRWSYSNGSSQGFLWLPNQPLSWSNTGTNGTANSNRKTAGVGNACPSTAVSEFAQNTNISVFATTRSCSAATSSTKTGTPMLQISPSSTTSTFTVNQVMVGSGLQAVAFGIVLAGARVDVEVAGRVLNATGSPTANDFTAQVASSGYGTFPAATGATTALTATSGEQFFPISTSNSTSLTFSSNPPADPTLASYTKSWVCEKSNGNDPTLERWPATGSSAAPPTAPWTNLSGGQFIGCKVTYTPPYLTLVKTLDKTDAPAAPGQPADFALTATGQNTPVSRVQGQANSVVVTKQPIAVGSYDFTETAPSQASPNWQFGWTWTGLVCTGGGAPTVTKDATSGQVTSAKLSVSAAQNVTCTYTNKANRPKLAVKKELFAANGTTAITRDTAVGANETLTYRLTFDNTQGTAAQTVAYTDYLRDVLDDANYVPGSLRYGSVAGSAPTSTVVVTPTGITATPTEMSGANPRQVIVGSVPALGARTLSFQVTVKANGSNASDRQAATAPLAGYQLRNYLAPTADPIPTTCPVSGAGESPSCTQNPVRAWTIRKDSQPEDGAMIHSGGNIYYRVKVTNYSGSDLSGVVVSDDLTDTLAATVWDPAAPSAVPMPNGISFYRADGTRIVSSTYDVSWANTGSAPNFSGSSSFDPDFPGDLPFPGGKWTFTTPSFTVPAKIGGEPVAYAIVGYAVQGGYVADPANAANKYAFSGSPVKALPNAVWVNTAQAGQATIGGQTLYPNRCSAENGGIAPGDTGTNYDCKTWHSLGESYFHIWKKSASPAGQNLVGSTFLLADTEADARNGVASRWLCRAENAVLNPGDANSVSGTPVGSTAGGTLQFGADSAAHASIEAANKTRATYNLTNGYKPGDAGFKTELPQCGLFFHLDSPSEGQAAGSWRAVDVRGGDTVAGGSDPLPDWRNSSQDGHGTYWLAETVSPANHQLLAQPMRLWVAPDSPSPLGLAPGNPQFYDYQGRLSMPVVGLGETAAPSQGMEGSSIRRECVSPYELPAYQQPACVMPTGWTMPVFDVKLKPLPLTGGYWFGPIMLGGGSILAFALAGIWWWRQRRALGAASTKRDLEGDAV